MARLISTTVSKTLTLTVNTLLESDEVVTRSFVVGDVVEGLRYVDHEEVKTITGKVTDITLRSVRSPKTITSDSDPKNTIAKDLIPLSVTIDASEQYGSNVVKVSCREIVEDAGVTDVKRVYCTMDLTAKIAQTYSDGSTTEFDLIPGTWLTDTTIFPGAYYKGSPEITDNFKLAYFIYTVSKNVVNITSLCLVRDKRVMIIPIKFIRNIGGVSETEPDAVPVVEVADTESFLTALDEIEDGVLTEIQLTNDIAITDPIEVTPGKEVILNLGGNTIEVPEAVNGRSIYAINNYGTLTLKNVEISARGIQNLVDPETGEGGTLTLGEGVHIVARDATGGAAVWSDGGTVIIEDGVVLETEYVGSVQESRGVGCVNSSGNLVIHGGTFNNVNERCYAIISSGDVVIDDNASIDVYGAHGALCIDAGEATINGGVYHSKNHYGLYCSNDGNALTGWVPRDAKVVVNGGDFTGGSMGGYKSVHIGSDVNTPVDSTIAIHGGTFHNPLRVQSNVSEVGGIKIYGGNFSDPVDPSMLAEGCVVSEEPNEEGFYVVTAA